MSLMCIVILLLFYYLNLSLHFVSSFYLSTLECILCKKCAMTNTAIAGIVYYCTFTAITTIVLLKYYHHHNLSYFYNCHYQISFHYHRIMIINYYSLKACVNACMWLCVSTAFGWMGSEWSHLCGCYLEQKIHVQSWHANPFKLIYEIAGRLT